MKGKLLKKVLLSVGAVGLLLSAVLCVHIYLVTRPKTPDATTIVMARVDFKQDINQEDADKITNWLYQQKGIDHVLCNPATDILIFTFFPVKTSANEVVENLKANFKYSKMVRFIPSEKDLQGGCPVASNSFSYKAYNFIRHIF